MVMEYLLAECCSRGGTCGGGIRVVLVGRETVVESPIRCCKYVLLTCWPRALGRMVAGGSTDEILRAANVTDNLMKTTHTPGT